MYFPGKIGSSGSAAASCSSCAETDNRTSDKNARALKELPSPDEGGDQYAEELRSRIALYQDSQKLDRCVAALSGNWALDEPERLAALISETEKVKVGGDPGPPVLLPADGGLFRRRGLPGVRGPRRSRL